MALWQFTLDLIPEKMLVERCGSLPPAIPEELAVNEGWFAAFQPPVGFERHIDSILPPRASWSKKMRMWGHEEGNDAHVGYTDESKSTVFGIWFRINAYAISSEFVRLICDFTKQLECVLVTPGGKILVPDHATVLTVVQNSGAKKYVDDPVGALQAYRARKTSR